MPSMVQKGTGGIEACIHGAIILQIHILGGNLTASGRFCNQLAAPGESAGDDGDFSAMAYAPISFL